MKNFDYASNKMAVSATLLLLMTLAAVCVVTCYGGAEENGTRICQSVDIRNSVANLNQLRGCRAVEGYVQIVLIDRANETDFDGYSFPELREITQYLLLYRVAGLRKLGHLFPNLTIIRGDTVFEDYGLVIYEMFHLQEVGLKSLTHIMRGAVRIEKNPNLCYVNTINWDLIAKWDQVKNYIGHNKDPRDCPSQTVCEAAKCPQSLCWSTTDCQIQQDATKNCHPLCRGGCSGPTARDCNTCSRVLTAEGECVENCPNGTYSYLNRRCITAEECKAVAMAPQNQAYPTNENVTGQEGRNYFTFNGTCIQECPVGYELTIDSKGCEPCKDKCRKICTGTNVDSISAAQNLRGCTYIKGSLEIVIKTGKHKTTAEELEESLSSIEEIEGYLKIARSVSIVNLNFLRNLTIIHGKQDFLDSDKYALVVLDNQNLQELWDWNTKTDLQIPNGRIFFHYNPKLCLSHIEKLVSVINHKNITNLEVARESNGDKFACNVTNLEVRVENRHTNGVVIDIVPPPYNTSHPTLLRYVIYYVKAPVQNVTAFEEPDECGDNGWRTQDFSVTEEDNKKIVESNVSMQTIITQLEPDTQYAFYVKTYTVESTGSQSAIQYFKTLPGKPSELTMLQAYSNSSSEIVVHWQPPTKPNGRLVEYVVTGFWQEDSKKYLDQRNYCKHELTHTTADSPTVPDFMTHKDSEVKTCCPHKSNYKPKDGFEKLCDNHFGVNKLSQAQFPEPDDTETCEKYFYNYLKISKLGPDGSRMPSAMSMVGESDMDKFPSTKSGVIMKNVTTTNAPRRYFNNRPIILDEINKDGTYRRFTKFVNANITTVTLGNLRHFSQYVIEVKACRETLAEEEQLRVIESDRCSETDIVILRTQKDVRADNIAHTVRTEIKNRTIQIFWDTPETPNGLTVAFGIEHKRTDVENPKPDRECISHLEYESNDRGYSIKDLPPGKYAFRLQSISLAGEGPFTEYIDFVIEEKSFSSLQILFAMFMLLVIIVLSMISFYVFYWKKKAALNNFRLIASVNPEYASVAQYVEDEWELSREKIEIVRELGQGTFGMVYEGILHPEKLRCAIKTVNDNATTNDHNIFLNEASVMKLAAKAHHIVRLLGVVSRGSPPYVVMELMALGDLKSYLRATRDSTDLLPPTVGTILNMAAQIADGMAFLESRKFVHRDLAARNCMISDDLTVKVGDFGMTRDVYETDYYRKGNKGLLPIRWMAPESLKDGVFSSQSDVWSYGVVLWEIATLAEQPYQGYSNEQVLHDVIAGRKLDTPVYCPEQLKGIMTACWKQRPNHRPTFIHIVSQLEQYTDEEFHKVSFYHSDDGMELRKSSSDYEEMRPNVDDGAGGGGLLIDIGKSTTNDPVVAFRRSGNQKPPTMLPAQSTTRENSYTHPPTPNHHPPNQLTPKLKPPNVSKSPVQSDIVVHKTDGTPVRNEIVRK